MVGRWTAFAAQLSIAAVAMVLLAADGRGDMITPSLQSHHAWGNVEDVWYNRLETRPVSGGCETTIGTDLVQLASDTLGSDGDQLCVNAYAHSHEDYMYDHQANAEVSYIFRPPSTELVIDFSGSSGDHSFESGLTYSLRDLTVWSELDRKSWECDLGHWVDDVLPYRGVYDVNPNHSYLITVGAYAQLGDMREGHASLVARFVPEPTTVALLALAAGLARHWSRRR